MTDFNESAFRDGDVLGRLAERVAEGRAVDWERELAAAPALASQIASLRRLAELAGELGEIHPADVPLGDRGPDAADDQAPRTWGHLRLVEEIGSGGFGTVYRAFDPVLQREVALKLRRERPGEAAAAAREFIDEARRLARVRHPHVLGIHGADVHDGRAGLWADLLRGVTLEDELEAGARFPLSRVLAVGEAVADALTAVHASGLVHGDVKGSNVALEPGDRPVLMDFGAGTDLRQPPAGAVFASPLSAAPERLAGRPLAPPADLYGLGVLLFRMIAGGRHPVEARSLEDLLAKQEGRATGAGKLPSVAAPRALRRLVARMLAPRPEARPTAAEAAERLRWIAAAPVRRRRRLAVAAVMASLALGTFAASIGLVRARRSAAAAEAARAETAAVNDFLTRVLASPRPSQSGRQVQVVDVLRQAEERVDALPAGSPIQGRLLGVLGTTYSALQKFSRAEPLLARAASVLETSAGARSPAALEAKAEWAVALERDQKLAEAARRAASVVAAGRGLRNPVPGGVVLAQLVLARVVEDRGHLPTAERMVRVALAARSGPHWAEDRMRLEAELDLSRILLDENRPGAVAGILQPLIERLQATHGERNGVVLHALNNLAVALSTLGRYEAAAERFRQLYEETSAWLGPEDRYTLLCGNNLGAALRDAGRPGEAAELEARLIPEAEKAFGPDTDIVLNLHFNHCLTLRQVGQLDAARDCNEKIATRLERVFGPDHWYTLLHGVNRAELDLETGRTRRALAESRETWSHAAATFGAEHPLTLAASTVLGAAMAASGETEAGIARLRSTLASQRKASGAADQQSLLTELRLSRALRGAGSSQEATALAREALDLAIPALGPQHPLVADLRREVALSVPAPGGAEPAIGSR